MPTAGALRPLLGLFLTRMIQSTLRRARLKQPSELRQRDRDRSKRQFDDEAPRFPTRQHHETGGSKTPPTRRFTRRIILPFCARRRRLENRVGKNAKKKAAGNKMNGRTSSIYCGLRINRRYERYPTNRETLTQRRRRCTARRSGSRATPRTCNCRCGPEPTTFPSSCRATRSSSAPDPDSDSDSSDQPRTRNSSPERSSRSPSSSDGQSASLTESVKSATLNHCVSF